MSRPQPGQPTTPYPFVTETRATGYPNRRLAQVLLVGGVLLVVNLLATVALLLVVVIGD